MVASALVTDRAQIDRFLRALYQGKPDLHQVLLWELAAKWSLWSYDWTEIAERAAALGGTSDVYIGCCTTDAVRHEYQRATVGLVSGMPGTWADLDSKLGHFPDAETAYQWVMRQDREPSVVVGSGHGVHVWWLYEEYWAFGSDAVRQAAQIQMTQATQRLREAARACGYGVDATQDLARVLRIPGTWNFKDCAKGGAALPVTILYESAARYPINRETKLYVVPATNGHVKPQVDVRESGALDVDQLATLLDDPVTTATWMQMRQSMGEDKDFSQSAYDMALANAAAQQGWSDQAMTDLLVFYQQYHAYPGKHDGYYPHTIAKARTLRPPERTDDAPPPPTDDDVPPGTRPDDVTTEQRIVLLNRLRTALNLPTLSRVIEYTLDPPVYLLELEGGSRFRVGTLHDLNKRLDIRTRLLHETGHFPPRLGESKWEEAFIRPLILAAERANLGAETSRRGQTTEWIRARLVEHDAAEQVDASCVRAGNIFRYRLKDGRRGIAIPSTEFAKWVSKEFTKLTPGELNERIAEMGGEHVSVNYYPAPRVRRQVEAQWLPDGWDDGMGEDE